MKKKATARTLPGRETLYNTPIGNIYTGNGIQPPNFLKLKMLQKGAAAPIKKCYKNVSLRKYDSFFL